MHRFVTVSVLILVAISTAAQAEDWPKWRGPRTDGISHEKGLAKEWPKDGPAKLWSVYVGKGWESPVVVDGIIYAFGRTSKSGPQLGAASLGAEAAFVAAEASVAAAPATKPAASQSSAPTTWSVTPTSQAVPPPTPMRGPYGTLMAIKADTGKIILAGSYVSPAPGKPEKPSMRATPTIEGDRIYTFDDNGVLAAWLRGDNRADKPLRMLWALDVLKELNVKPIKWGCASSVVIDGDKLYVQCGLTGPIAVAVDKNNGKIIWRSQAEGPAGYSTIAETVVDGQKQLIVEGGTTVVAMTAEGGKTLWTLPYETEYQINATTPIIHDGRAMLINEYKFGKCWMLESKKTRPPRRGKTRSSSPRSSRPFWRAMSST